MTHVWLLFGAVLIVFDVLFGGIGFLFAGLGAITLSLLMSFDWISSRNLSNQFSWFFVFTFCWAAILWKPLRVYSKHSREEYKNIVGDKAIVIDQDLLKGEVGKVRWSGTNMNAEIHKSCEHNRLKVGDEVEIVEVKKNTVYVRG